MSDYLPEAVKKGLEEARKAAIRKSNRLCVHAGDKVYRINRLWDEGFSMDVEHAPKLRGHVQIYDGSRHLYQALVITSREEEGERIFDFKWSTAAADGPALDFEQVREKPKGLIPFWS